MSCRDLYTFGFVFRNLTMTYSCNKMLMFAYTLIQFSLTFRQKRIMLIETVCFKEIISILSSHFRVHISNSTCLISETGKQMFLFLVSNLKVKFTFIFYRFLCFHSKNYIYSRTRLTSSPNNYNYKFIWTYLNLYLLIHVSVNFSNRNSNESFFPYLRTTCFC